MIHHFKLIGNPPNRDNNLQQAELLIKIRNAKTPTIKKALLKQLERLQSGHNKVQFYN
jgi:hypothetical protein